MSLLSDEDIAALAARGFYILNAPTPPGSGRRPPLTDRNEIEAGDLTERGHRDAEAPAGQGGAS